VPGPAGAAGRAGDTGPAGPAGPTGADGKPRRVERYTQPANASGVATFTWPACTATPDVDVIPGWITIGGVQQMVTGGVTSQTASGATVAVKISQGTIALSGTPFRQADTGTASTVRVICN
jgi:hypothetical protein